MKKVIPFLVVLSLVLVMIIAIPLKSRGQDTGIEVMAQKLKLDQSQITTIVELFKAYRQKQAAMPSAGDVLLANQSNLKQLFTATTFDRAKAQQIVGRITATVDRLL